MRFTLFLLLFFTLNASAGVRCNKNELDTVMSVCSFDNLSNTQARDFFHCDASNPEKNYSVSLQLYNVKLEGLAGAGILSFTPEQINQLYFPVLSGGAAQNTIPPYVSIWANDGYQTIICRPGKGTKRATIGQPVETLFK